MKKFIIGDYERITKKTAEKLYNHGGSVYICPHKINPCGLVGAMCINKENGMTFIDTCNAAAYYNCNKETGNYLSFYKKI